MSASSGRSTNLLRVGIHRDDEACPPSEGPKCKFFLWKDDAKEEGYYKEHLCKMRFELRRKEDFNEVLKAQKKVVKL
ncbi:unnamed protein product [Lactuca virosa]|uniref:Zinc finger GRF-type domain-containing protein n=1 Tax=Lactuca virosa TaxID=75947 RepID=A0AAU9PDP9_9ASTR|nr:unnamed protein product [Lactuca virosa]